MSPALDDGHPLRFLCPVVINIFSEEHPASVFKTTSAST